MANIDAIALIVTTCITAVVGWVIKALLDRVKDYAHESREWRTGIEQSMREQNDLMNARMDEQDKRMDAVLNLQCSQTRSDLIHRAHRYMDDLGCASTEEKQSFWAQYEDYQQICEANDIENHFVDGLAESVMGLPTREYERSNA